MKKTEFYLHTLNGLPASFDGDQIVYVMSYGSPGVLAKSLKQIRGEQKASREWRRSQGFPDDFEYGYRRYA